jgi:zeta-carotene desaturase
MPESSDVRVTIVGAGIAGLTAALRLSQRGYKVTVYESASVIGGNLNVSKVFPHMFLNWYNNFWKVADDLDLIRGKDFEPISSFRFLRKGEYPKYMQWTNLGSVRSVWQNLLSGVAPLPDLLLGSYSVLDLLSQNFDRTKILDRTSVNGFFASRPYATNRMAELHDEFLETVWSLHSYLTSVSSYQDFVKYSFRHPEPQLWRLSGDIDTKILSRLAEKIGDSNIHKNSIVTEVFLHKNKVCKIKVQRPKEEPRVVEDFDYLILAVPPKWLAYLSMGPYKTDKEPHRIVTLLPEVAQLRRLRSEAVPVLNVSFKRKLPDISKEYVALLGSMYCLTFTEIPHPKSLERTTLAVAASDFYALPESIKRKDVGTFSVENLDAFSILSELSHYIPFNPGKSWPDPDSDIDYENSRFDDGTEHELHVDEVGSDQWCLEANYERVRNLFFAGDFCKTSVSITTIEAAVMSGLKAASALWSIKPLGDRIEIIEPESYPLSAIMALKLWMTPSAFAAKLWSMAYDAATELPLWRLPADHRFNPTDLLWAPYVLGADWWLTMWSMYSETLSRQKQGSK